MESDLYWLIQADLSVVAPLSAILSKWAKGVV